MKKLTAYNIANKIFIKKLNKLDHFFNAKIVYRNASSIELHYENHKVYIYGFGTMVFFNFKDDSEIIKLINKFTSHYSENIVDFIPDYEKTSDSISIVFGENNKVYFDYTELAGENEGALRILALVLAHSVDIEIYELHVDKMLNDSKHYINKAKHKGKISHASSKLIKFIGECMHTKQSIISNLLVLDNPEETWEDTVLDKLYQDSKKMFEIDQRFKVIDYKLQLIKDNLSMILGMVSTKNSFWLEMTIILLILFEIIITLSKYFK